MKRPSLFIALVLGLVTASLPAGADDGLRVATFSVDISPPLGQPVGQGFIPVLTTVEHPLLARGIILKDAGVTCVVCTLDLMEVHNESYDFLRQAIGKAAGVPASHVALQTLHQHTAPAIDTAAHRFEFPEDHPRRVATADYLVDVTRKIAAAIRDSRNRWRRVTHIGTGRARVERVASNRRIPREDGSIQSRSSNTKSSPELRELPEGLIDPWVRTVSLHDGERAVAHLHYYASHPQSFYGDGRASYDVPGIVRERLEETTGAFQLYLTGCGGDVAFGKYNDGSRQARDELAERLEHGIERSIAGIKLTPVEPLRWSVEPITFPARTDEAFGEAANRRILDDPKSNDAQRRKAAIALAWIERLAAQPARPVELNCLSIGNVRMLHLPGEPFVQFQLAAQQMRPDRFVCVAGYGDCGMGYIGGDRIYTDRGGYEQTYTFAGPCEELFLTTISSLLDSDGSATTVVKDFEGKKTAWGGFDRYDFTVDGRKCLVVTPKNVAEGRPWIWRARFFGHEPQADIALLRKGFHLAYCDVAGLFGSPQAVRHWNAFYSVMTERHGLAKRPALEGMSRGGLIVYNWAAANPDKVACIYGDAPVCDFKSWPGGKGKGKGAETAWLQCLKAYDLTEAEAVSYQHNPIDSLKPLADAGVPLLHVVGDADAVVPVEENTAIIEQRYNQLGGSIQVIHKPGVGHHPHSLKDPTPIVAFVLKHARPQHQPR